MESIYHKLTEILPVDRIRTEEPMCSHTTFRVGGTAEFFVTPGTFEEVSGTVRLCKELHIPYYIVGNGSNLLVSDQGYRGVLIHIGKELSHILCAQAGALLSVIANRAMEGGLSGFEFASGIPGTLGGACIMNAGAYGGEMGDVLTKMTVLTPEGELCEIPREQMELGYRSSIAARKGYSI